MKSCQYIYQPNIGWKMQYGEQVNPSILLAFGSGNSCTDDTLASWWQENFPNAQLIGCSSAGEILETQVHSNSLVVTGIQFESTHTEAHAIDFQLGEDSFEIGAQLAKSFSKDKDKLKLCFVLSDGLNINGSRLVEGLKQELPKNTLLTGGLAADDERFNKTLVCYNGPFETQKVVALGLYGDNIEIEYGSMGGWDSFGPSRLVTHAENNILYTIDDQNALVLYKKYLGTHAKDLPSSALRFPLLVTLPNGQKVVRTILAVDEASGSMTFAGDIPIGSSAELMCANYDRLIDGASDAAHDAMRNRTTSPELAILISCVGRKLVLGQRIEEEIEVIQDSFGDKTRLAGFYSYGEICPFNGQDDAILHNQTMTITSLREYVKA